VAADPDRDLTLSEIDPSNEVLDPALKVLEQSRRRILIVDAVGLGTTLEAGILRSELMRTIPESRESEDVASLYDGSRDPSGFPVVARWPVGLNPHRNRHPEIQAA